MMFDTLYKLNNSVFTESSDQYVFAGAAVNGRKAAIVIANANNEEISLKLDAYGFTATDIQVCRIDEEHRYTVTGEDAQDQLVLPAHGCIEIKLWDLD